MIPGTPPRDPPDLVRATPQPPLDHSLAAESPREHLLNALTVMDFDGRQGFWERRAAYASVRRRIIAALELLERTP